MLLAAQTGRSWLPRGGCETPNATFSRIYLKVFGALGRDMLHVMAAGSAKSSVFKVFLEALHQKYGRVAFVTDNAKSHRSKLVQEYLESTGGDMVLIYLPPYTPQLNPIEIQWRMIKARLAARYFATEDEMVFHHTAGRVRRGAARPDIHPADGLMQGCTMRHHSKGRPTQYRAAPHPKRLRPGTPHSTAPRDGTPSAD